MDLVTVMVLAVIGFWAGVFGPTTGVSGAITVPALVVLGLSPTTAVATSLFSMSGTYAAGALRYGISSLSWRLSQFVVAAVFGSFLGSHILLQLSASSVHALILIATLVALGLMLVRKRVGQMISDSVAKNPFALIYIFLLGIYQGIIGIGFGTFLVITLVLFGASFLESAKSMTFINLATVITSSLVFISAGTINYQYGLPLLAALAAGGWVGAHFALAKGSRFVEVMTIIAVLALMAKLVFSP